MCVMSSNYNLMYVDLQRVGHDRVCNGLLSGIFKNVYSENVAFSKQILWKHLYYILMGCLRVCFWHNDSIVLSAIENDHISKYENNTVNLRLINLPMAMALVGGTGRKCCNEMKMHRFVLEFRNRNVKHFHYNIPFLSNSSLSCSLALSIARYLPLARSLTHIYGETNAT